MQNSFSLLLKKHLGSLVIAMLICGVIAVLLGKEVDYDIANYHYYNPFAFFNGRWNIDYWPGSNFTAYLNPTIDFPTYWLINHCSPMLGTFLFGALHGINAWLIFLISVFFLQNDRNREPIVFAGIIATMGMSSAIALSEMGSYIGDNTVAIFVLAGILCAVIGVQKILTHSDEKSSGWFLTAGLIMGAAVGLKLTAALFALSLLISNLFLPLALRKKLYLLLIVSAALGIGFLLTYGHWMWFLWNKFHNPFYPFFNHIFQSPDFPLINWRETRYFPNSLMQKIFFPFYFATDGKTADRFFIDFRIAIVYGLLILCAIKYLLAYLKVPRARVLTSPNLSLKIWLLIFFICSYLLWEFYFANIRYMVPLQILAPLMIYICIYYLFESAILRFISIALLFCFLILSTYPLATERVRYFGNSYFGIRMPGDVKHIEHATVLVAYPKLMKIFWPWPVNFLIPSFPKSWRFIGIAVDAKKFEFDSKTRQIIQNTTGPIYLMGTSSTMYLFIPAVKKVGLDWFGDHRAIFTDRYPRGINLCQVHKK